MSRLKVYCFGAFMAVLDGEDLTGFRSDKARALLAYLLLAGPQPIPRIVLQELLWQDYEPKSARANLRSTLSNLAKLLKPLNLLHITRKTVQFEHSEEEVWSDVWAFEALTQQKPFDRKHLQKASPKWTLAQKLHVGDFLAGLRLEDSAPIAQWRDKEAQTYHRQLIELFPHNLPRQGTTFIGRQEELDAIMRKVLAPDYPLITLMGTGGVGKTRLALRLGEQARGHFNDGVWWVPLAGLQKAEAERGDLPERLVMAIGRALNLTFKPHQQPTEELFEHLRKKEALLLLDNLEHLLPARLDEDSAAVDFILDLLRETEQLKILITSRQQLNVPEEFVFDIEGLPLPEKITPAMMADAQFNSALTLFAERANRLGPRFALSARNLPAVSRICQELAGLPLGIELAAGLLASQTVAQIADSMIKAQNRLVLCTSWRSLPPRQRSLWALFEHSWQLLTPSQQEIFAQLAVFRDGFTNRAAFSVVDATDADLRALLAKSLLQQEHGPFQMHQLVHDFAAQKLASREEADLQERHAGYYLVFLSQQEKKIEQASNREPLIETGRELNNIRAAWHWAVGQSKVELLRQSASGFRLLTERLGLLQEGIAAIQSAIKQLRGLSESQAVKETLAVLLLQQTISLFQTTKLDLALISAQEAAQLATSPQTLGRIAFHWSGICNRQSNYSAAQDQLLQAQSFFRQTGNQEEQKKVLHSLAILAISLGEYAKTEEYLEQLDAHYEKETQFKGLIRLNLGVVHRMQGHYQQALLYQEDALTRFRQIEESFRQGLAITNHAVLALHLGDYEQANSYFEQADKLWQEGDFECLKDALYAFWGLLHHHLGDHKKALAMAEQAEAISQAKAELYYLGLDWLIIGHAKRGLGCQFEAKGAYQEALRLWQANQKEKASMEALGGLAAVAYERERLDEALNYVEQIMAHRKKNPTLVGTIEPMRILLTCIKILEAAGQTERADSLLEESYQLLMQRANDLEDEQLCESFLQNVSFHREIVRQWCNRARSYSTVL